MTVAAIIATKNSLVYIVSAIIPLLDVTMIYNAFARLFCRRFDDRQMRLRDPIIERPTNMARIRNLDRPAAQRARRSRAATMSHGERIQGVCCRARILPSQMRAAQSDPFLTDQLRVLADVSPNFIVKYNESIIRYVRESILPDKVANCQIKFRFQLAMQSWRMYPLLNIYQRYALYRWFHGSDLLPCCRSLDVAGERANLFEQAPGSDEFHIEANESPDPHPIQPHFESYIPSTRFTGGRQGYVFKLGRRGLGYYLDYPPVGDPSLPVYTGSRPDGPLGPTPLCVPLIQKMRNRQSGGEVDIVNYHNDFVSMPTSAKIIYDEILKDEDDFGLPYGLLGRCFTDLIPSQQQYVVRNREYFALNRCFKAEDGFYRAMDQIAQML